MPRPRTNEYWRERVRERVENAPRRSAISIERELKLEYSRDPELQQYGPPPSDRTVRNISKEFGDLPPEQRIPYQFFSWPESMESGALPWEAASACLELLRYFYEECVSSRPTNELARWFWRVTLAVPDASIGERSDFAATLWASHILGGQYQSERSRAVEGVLMFAPWKSKGNVNAYIAATRNKEKPIPSYIVLPPDLRKARPLTIKANPPWLAELMRYRLKPEKKRAKEKADDHKPSKGGKTNARINR